MFSIKEWCYIKNFKSLSCDEHGRSWKATNNINGFLIHLHLWAKDHPLEKTCLLYQVDSKGRLFLLSIMHVRQIKTTNDSILILYTADARHACLEIWSIPKWRWAESVLCRFPHPTAHTFFQRCPDNLRRSRRKLLFRCTNALNPEKHEVYNCNK